MINTVRSEVNLFTDGNAARRVTGNSISVVYSRFTLILISASEGDPLSRRGELKTKGRGRTTLERNHLLS